MEATKSQQKIVKAIKDSNWVTVAEISKITGIAEGHVRNALKSRFFDNLVRQKRLQKQVNGMRWIVVYQYPVENGEHTSQALRLASQHKGIFGQLYWVRNENIEAVA